MRETAPTPWTYDAKERMLYDANGQPVAMLWDAIQDHYALAQRIMKAMFSAEGGQTLPTTNRLLGLCTDPKCRVHGSGGDTTDAD